MAGNIARLRSYWAKLWMKVSKVPLFRRPALHLAGWFVPPFYGRVQLAKLVPQGYVSPRAIIFHPAFQPGRHCFIGDGVTVYQDKSGGEVVLGDDVHIHQGTIIQTGSGGHLHVGDKTHIQPNCQISAYLGHIQIGCRVEIAPGCAFYPYNHGIAADLPVRKQPLVSRKGITVGNDAWLGYGVVLLDGAQIGEGAVIGAGSVVTGEIPAGAVAAGVPARVIKYRAASN
jgi:acetyltransferase-like isoleucine patch superfamily enzyme